MNKVSRREFLAASAAAVAGGTVAAAAGEYGGFHVGVQSYCFREFNTERALKNTRELGLGAIELYQKHAPPDSSLEQVRALIRECRAAGVKPVAFGVQGFTKNDDKNRHFFEFARQLGVGVMTADPAPDSFGSLDKLVEEYKIAIAIHPHGPMDVVGVRRLHRWYSADAILKAVKDHHPRIGSCLDTGHLIRAAQLGQRLDPAEEIRKMGARNLAIHLKDHDNQADVDVVYGRGALDVPAVLRALREVKFTGPISVEYEAHPEDPLPDMRACLNVLKQAIRGLG